jgi:hypothetical protein
VDIKTLEVDLMSKTFAFVAAAAMLFGATAFAQDQSGSSSSPDTASSAPADSSASSDTAGTKKHHKHGSTASRGGRGRASNDHVADKLNACMTNAAPGTDQQECLRQAASS